jgi:hypothetical protein
MTTLDPLPYWTMSRLELPPLGRFDWLYKQPPPKLPRRSASRQVIQPIERSPTNEIVFERVGYRPSEYLAVPRREPLRGLTAPDEHGIRGAFADLRTPLQITKKFNGDPILSVPIQTSSITARTTPPVVRKRELSKPTETQAGIHEVLFEESVDPHEEIDPWGFSRNEKVVVHEGVFRGIPLTVSRLRPAKK